jgi:hypothetical protein
LEKSWAEPFRSRVLPLVDEQVLSDTFSADMGRPNVPIRLLVGLHILKENNDLTDREVLDHLEFNLQWQHALGVDPATAHVCQKTLHNFRVRLLDEGRARRMFAQVVQAMKEMDGLDIEVQRLDSTHVMSNIAVLSRLGLFVETVTHFLKRLQREAPTQFSKLLRGYGERYLDREGYFADAKKKHVRRRLGVVAQDVYRLVECFRDDEDISQMEAYGLLKRLFKEQCVVVDSSKATQKDSEVGGNTGQEMIGVAV